MPSTTKSTPRPHPIPRCHSPRLHKIAVSRLHISGRDNSTPCGTLQCLRPSTRTPHSLFPHLPRCISPRTRRLLTISTSGHRQRQNASRAVGGTFRTRLLCMRSSSSTNPGRGHTKGTTHSPIRPWVTARRILRTAPSLPPRPRRPRSSPCHPCARSLPLLRGLIHTSTRPPHLLVFHPRTPTRVAGAQGPVPRAAAMAAARLSPSCAGRTTLTRPRTAPSG